MKTSFFEQKSDFRVEIKKLNKNEVYGLKCMFYEKYWITKWICLTTNWKAKYWINLKTTERNEAELSKNSNYWINL